MCGMYRSEVEKANLLYWQVIVKPLTLQMNGTGGMKIVDILETTSFF